VLEEVEVADTAFFGAAMPFVTGNELTRGDTRFDLVAGDQKVGEFLAARIGNLDSTLRKEAHLECGEGHSLMLHPPKANDGKAWSIGVVHGTVERWTPRLLHATVDTLHPDTTAIRLALQVSSDTAGTFRTTALHASAEHLEHDAVEILIVQASREVAVDGGTLDQQIFLVAERPMGGRDSEWKVAYHRENIDDPDQLVTMSETGRLLMGSSRRPVLLLDGKYRDGGGGVFVGRVAPGAWREVASWYTGC
jgi:hypothetical protein